jgi:hypothetical protein
LFGAPVGLFFSIPAQLRAPQWAHLGMFINNSHVAGAGARPRHLPAGSLGGAYRTTGVVLGLPEDWMLYCGMALGYPDEAHPINGWRSDREPLEAFATFRGF